MPAGPKRIGIDFDNTIIDYTDVFRTAAATRGLLPDDFAGLSKRAVRDDIRNLPDGELAWQRLQGHVYGRGIGGATMIDGVQAFLNRCRAEGHTVLIVSHKTEFGHFDPERVSLRQAALGWMSQQGFFDEDRFGIPHANVYFETTRSEKLRRIAALGCDCFIDDLEEVLTDPEFPAGVGRILFSAEAGDAAFPFPVCSTWQQIEALVFDASR